jgi:hypothetical protein
VVKLLPTRDEFRLEENEVFHEPTGARWTAYSGIAEPHMENLGHLGDVLPDGNHNSHLLTVGRMCLSTNSLIVVLLV